VATAVPDSHRDLLDAQFATLATIDRNGFPQLTEVWFFFDEFIPVGMSG
jgi:pyridoxamine 5'-phosphate oxidase-like protein